MMNFAIDGIFNGNGYPGNSVWIGVSLVDSTTWPIPDPVGELMTFSGLTNWPDVNDLWLQFDYSEWADYGTGMKVWVWFIMDRTNEVPNGPPGDTAVNETGFISTAAVPAGDVGVAVAATLTLINN